MKPKLLILLCLLAGCRPLKEHEHAPFKGAQPERADKAAIPEMIMGTYKSLIDSSFLIVTDQEIVYKHISNFSAPLAELDSVSRLTIEDSCYRLGNATITDFVKNDSFFERTVSSDTLYSGSTQYSLKKAKGYYFLNKRLFKGEDQWYTKTLRATEAGLLMGEITSTEIIYLLVNDEPDSIPYARPSEDKLLEFFNNRKYINESKFIRIEYGLHHDLFLQKQKTYSR